MEDRIHLTSEDIQATERATWGQVSNPLWTKARVFSLTASIHGKTVDACSRGNPPPSLCKSLYVTFDGSEVHATKWGIDNGPVAIKMFSEKMKLEVTPSGFWYHPCGYLGGSPVGFVGEKYLIEVKCPYEYRSDVLETVFKVQSLEELYNERTLTLKKGTYVITYDGKWYANESHRFYHQIQACLHYSDREMCYLVVWTTKSLVPVKIFREEKWLENISILKSFYVNHSVPYVKSRISTLSVG